MFVFRYTNNVNVWFYEANIKGYTILCYGKINVSKKLLWKLALLSPKIKETSFILIQDAQIEKDALSDYYKPNVFNRICKCTVNVHQNTFATFRLTTSCPDAKIKLRCSKNEKTVAEIQGVGSVVLPTLILELDAAYLDQSVHSKLSLTGKHRRSKSRSSSMTAVHSNIMKKNKSDRASTGGSIRSYKMEGSVRKLHKERKMEYKDAVYVVEGFVENNSWPLTKQEWDMVEKLRDKELLKWDSTFQSKHK